MGGFVDSSQCKWPLEQVVLIATTTIATSANPITNSQGSQKIAKSCLLFICTNKAKNWS